jgi:hypothetical protein
MRSRRYGGRGISSCVLLGDAAAGKEDDGLVSAAEDRSKFRNTAPSGALVLSRQGRASGVLSVSTYGVRPVSIRGGGPSP